MERAEALQHELRQLMEVCREALETRIPELKESEDERIRKELVAFFKGMQDSDWHEKYWHDLEIDRILAYLEKQKDHFRDGFQRGYEQAEKDTIERAESHLESVLLNFLDVDTVKWIIKDFKKAMEEQK